MDTKDITPVKEIYKGMRAKAAQEGQAVIEAFAEDASASSTELTALLLQAAVELTAKDRDVAELQRDCVWGVLKMVISSCHEGHRLQHSPADWTSCGQEPCSTAAHELSYVKDWVGK